MTELFNNYTLAMMKHDSKRALKSVGDYSERLASAIYEVAQELKAKHVPSIFLVSGLTMIALTTQHFV